MIKTKQSIKEILLVLILISTLFSIVLYDKSYASSSLISENALSLDGYTFAKNHYMNSSGTVWDYPNNHKIGGSAVKGYKVTIHAKPRNNGVLTGYASISNGQKIPVYWDDEGTVEVEKNIEGGTAYAYLLPEMLTSTSRNVVFTITITEYQDVTLRKKLNTDSLTANISIDLDSPVVNISINNATQKITVNAYDYLTDTDSINLQYSVNGRNTFYDYTGPITYNDDIQYITVRATDKLGNSGNTISESFSHTLNSSGSAVSNKYISSYYYRTPMFHHWLLNTGKSN